MKYSFICYGHENITARHKTTLEFTKDKELRLEGDCIIGVGADFSLDRIKEFIKSLGGNTKISITIEAMDYDSKGPNNNPYNERIKDKKIIEKISCEANPGFNSDKEIVVRKGDFVSERTLGIKADKAAWEIGGLLKRFLTKKDSKIEILIEAVNK